jgi:hypothetical protein
MADLGQSYAFEEISSHPRRGRPSWPNEHHRLVVTSMSAAELFPHPTETLS